MYYKNNDVKTLEREEQIWSPSANKHITGDSIDTLLRQPQRHDQQLPRALLPLPLHPIPRVLFERPEHAVLLSRDRRRARRAAEEGQLAARRPCHDGLLVGADGEGVGRAQDACLQEVEGCCGLLFAHLVNGSYSRDGLSDGRTYATLKNDGSRLVLLTLEERHGVEPKVFVAVAELLEDLQHQR